MSEKKYPHRLYYHQQLAVEYDLDTKETLLLEYMNYSKQWAEPKQEGGKNYYRINVGKAMSDMPGLKLTSKSGVLRKIRTLIEKGLINRIIVDNQPFYHITDSVHFSQYGVSNSRTTIDNINYNNIMSLAEKIMSGEIQIKEKEKEKVRELVLFLDGEVGDTDLSGLMLDDAIEIWNNAPELYKLPRVNVRNRATKTYAEMQKNWVNIQKVYTQDDFYEGLNAYLKDIDDRQPGTSYSSHRFNFQTFIKQSNGFEKFVNI